MAVYSTFSSDLVGLGSSESCGLSLRTGLAARRGATTSRAWWTWCGRCCATRRGVQTSPGPSPTPCLRCVSHEADATWAFRRDLVPQGLEAFTSGARKTDGCGVVSSLTYGCSRPFRHPPSPRPLATRPRASARSVPTSPALLDRKWCHASGTRRVNAFRLSGLLKEPLGPDG